MILALLVSTMISGAHAQEVKIKDDMRDKEYTTIEVRKKNKISHDLEYRIEEGKETIEGDAAPLAQDARKSHKTACTDWKKDFRSNNVGNKVIALSCGTMSCSTAGVETTCRSEGSYKVRVKMTADDTATE